MTFPNEIKLLQLTGKEELFHLFGNQKMVLKYIKGGI